MLLQTPGECEIFTQQKMGLPIISWIFVNIAVRSDTVRFDHVVQRHLRIGIADFKQKNKLEFVFLSNQKPKSVRLVSSAHFK